MQSEQEDDQIGRVSDEELQKIALEQLHEDPKKKEDDIRSIRQWLDGNNHTKRNDDRFILMFLRSCKFDHEKTKKKLDTSFALYRDYPHWLHWTDISSPSMDHLLDLGVYVMLNYNILTGTKVFMLRLGLIDAATVFEDVISLDRMIFEVAFLEDQTQIVGIDLVADMTGFRMWHLQHYTPNFIRIYAKFINSLPSRVKGLHILHMPMIFRSLVSLAKPFLSKKLKNRIHIHGDLNSFHKLILPASLPEEYGGTAGPTSKFIELTKQRILKNKEYLRSISERNG